MPGMKITLSAAMRARDVSTPRPEDMAGAEGADQAAAKPAADTGTAASTPPGKRRGPRSRGSRPVPPPAKPGPQAAGPEPAAPPPAVPAQDDRSRGEAGRTRRHRSRTRRGQR